MLRKPRTRTTNTILLLLLAYGVLQIVFILGLRRGDIELVFPILPDDISSYSYNEMSPQKTPEITNREVDFSLCKNNQEPYIRSGIVLPKLTEKRIKRTRPGSHEFKCAAYGERSMGNTTATAKGLAEKFAKVRSLFAKSRRFCHNTVMTLSYHSALLHDVTLNTQYITVNDDDKSLSNIIEMDPKEYLNFQPGFIELGECCSESDAKAIRAMKGKLKNSWNSYVIQNQNDSVSGDVKSYDTGIVVVRYEYANRYWCIVDLYNAFLTLCLWELSPKDAVVVLADSHPHSVTDDLWRIFGGGFRLCKQNDMPKHFRSMVWMSHRHSDTDILNGVSLPLFSEFREFVYRGQGLEVNQRRRCKISPLVIVFIWRRDYVAHPRNPSGSVKRKILNEEDVLNATINSLSEHHVRGVQFDSLNISEQLKIISQTDILIGIHGAGLAYGALLPPGAGMLELYPRRYLRAPNNHMEILARANGVRYKSWYNHSPALEDRRTESLNLPVQQVIRLIRNMVLSFCSSTEQ